jgi:DNA-directed RNA polymerase
MNKIAKTQTKETKRQRVGRHRRSFRPNLVHSIDGALMRLFILEHYKRTGHRINHLHDCVLVHPNDVDDIYDVIRDVYCSPAMKTLAKDLVFSRFKQNTTGKYFEKIEAIEKIYTSNMESLGYLNKETFDPRKCYKFEGAK